MNEITSLKNQVKYQQWSEMINSRCASGMSVVEWCTENEVNPKTYYYRLKRLRKTTVEALKSQDIVPLSAVPEGTDVSERIEVIRGNLKISIPDNFKADTLKRIMDVILC